MNTNAKAREIEKPVNCWQYKSCGREPGGAHADRFGVCPAATDTRLDGVHGGKNAGRACWVIAGSFTTNVGEVARAKASKDCVTCDFYNSVQHEEGRYIWPTAFLQKLLAGKKVGRR